MSLRGDNRETLLAEAEGTLLTAAIEKLGGATLLAVALPAATSRKTKEESTLGYNTDNVQETLYEQTGLPLQFLDFDLTHHTVSDLDPFVAVQVLPVEDVDVKVLEQNSTTALPISKKAEDVTGLQKKPSSRWNLRPRRDGRQSGTKSKNRKFGEKVMCSISYGFALFVSNMCGRIFL